MFRLDTAIIFRLDTAIIFHLDTAIIFRLDTAFIDTFPIRVFAPERIHINDFELLRTVLGTEFRRTSFLC